jgi:transcriptional regulator with XRE-family HTH domain
VKTNGLATFARTEKARGVTFRQLLQEELVQRCRANPNYSLRSLARSLGVEPSSLSQIINGKRPLSKKMKLRLGSGLGLTVKEIERVPTADSEYSDIKGAIPLFQQLTLDAFALIADWYHYAILELTYVEGFKCNHGWISRRLGITRSEVNIAVERLVRMDLLEIGSDGKWRDLSANGALTHLKPAMSSEAARKYQMQLLELSKKSIEEVDVKKRNHTSATLCFDPQDLERAMNAITVFRRKFATDFQPKQKAKEVYQLQISFFPLSKQISTKDCL